jgi:hypothetical protein
VRALLGRRRRHASHGGSRFQAPQSSPGRQMCVWCPVTLLPKVAAAFLHARQHRSKDRHICQLLGSFPRSDKKVKHGQCGCLVTLYRKRDDAGFCSSHARTEAADTVILIVVVFEFLLHYSYYLKYQFKYIKL